MTDTYPSPSTGNGPPPLPAGLADERFAVNLREQRERQGLSQAEIARDMRERGWKWHAQTVQRIESGHRKVTIGEAEAIARILHTTADRLTWPGTAASAAALLDMTIARGLNAYEDIAKRTSTLLWVQGQLAVTVGEVERAGYHGSDKIRMMADEAREVMEADPHDAVEGGREEYEQMRRTTKDLTEAEG